MGLIFSRDAHNRNVLHNLLDGDLIRFDRGVYAHWAMCVGNHMVIHITGDGNPMPTNSTHAFCIAGIHYEKAIVRIESFETVLKESKAWNRTRKSDKKYGSPEKNTERMLESAFLMRDMTVAYHPLMNNCEHFVTLWRYGVKRSEQGDNTIFLAAAGIVATIIGTSIKLAASTV